MPVRARSEATTAFALTFPSPTMLILLERMQLLNVEYMPPYHIAVNRHNVQVNETELREIQEGRNVNSLGADACAV
jgi:hypothetical protein